MRGIAASLACALCLFATNAWADLELKNDSFSGNGGVPFQVGFVAGEAAASRFLAPAPGRQLLRVQFIFGGASGTKSVTLKVFDDSSSTTSPGAELFSGDYDVTASDSALQQIDLTTDNVVVPQQFRVALFWQHDNLPSIGRDTDGIKANKNFIFTIPPSAWSRSEDVGLQGDWILRAFISDTGGPLPDAGVQPDGGGGQPDAGVGQQCNTNVQCPAGQFCDTANHACTFECRMNSDCGDGTCNSLGMCIADSGGGGGCCETDGGGAQTGGVLLGLGAIVLLVRRRR
jgi:Cys-rich repeat protein